MFIYNKLIKLILLASGVFFDCLLATIPTRAQITSDGTVSTQVETTDNQNFIITGGERAGNNLFHSFETFSVPNGGSASFNNASTIQNIFSRVTGGSVSDIDGLIKTNPSANLFLINPNGIIFGANARLDVGGSFLATTADSINFADSKFSATATQTEPLLTVNTPIGLQFGERPGRIEVRSIEIGSGGFPIDGLSVDTGNTMALVGGDLQIDNGTLLAPGGRVELGSVGSFSFVDLTPINEGWVLGYEQVQEFQNIQLSQASVDTTDIFRNIPSGNIQLYGRAIAIANSLLGGINFANNSGGTLSIKASEFLSINSNSFLNTNTFSSGTAGNIEIKTKQLLVSNDSTINTSSNGEGKGGNITINASDSLEVITMALLSTRATQNGNAGNIKITTGKLILEGVGQISSSTFGEGDGGKITVDASESVEISGQVEINERLVGSGLLAQTRESDAIGDGGTLTVNTRHLNVRDGGRISVGAVEGSEGKAGSLNINASESVNINGSGSTLLAESESSKPAGNLTINTNRLTVANGGKVNVSATGTGEAGSLNIDARDITLEDRGTLTAETSAGDKGNITISNANTLLLRNNSNITTNAQETATGGDITINSEGIALIENSNITAKAFKGRGGDINITTQRLFQEPDSKITTTSEFNLDGTITIESPDVDPTSGLIELSDVPIDAATILAQNLCKFEDDKIAKGSSFIITGRGGLTPTSAEPLENLDRVVRWANRDDLKVSKNGLVGVRQRSDSDTPEKSYPVIQQAQGWVTTSDGSVWLVANAPETIPQNSKIVHPDCRTLESEATIK